MAQANSKAQGHNIASLQMSRRHFLLSSLVGAVALMGSNRSAWATPLQQDSRPNVLFIVMNDLNDWVGCLNGHPQAYTPNIDSLAREGTLFANAHCPAPVCHPSRIGTLTGLHPNSTGIYQNKRTQFRDRYPCLPTMPRHFASNRYDVRGTGNIFAYPDPKSWTNFYPSLTQQRPPEPAITPELLDPAWVAKSILTWGPLDISDDDMSDAKVVEWAISQLQSTFTAPFFLAVGIHSPHSPMVASRSYFDRFPPESVILPPVKDDDLVDVPPYARWWPLKYGQHARILEKGLWHHCVAGYLACTSFGDAMVGRLLDALAASPYADNTIVVLWSDNGYHLGEKTHWEKSTLWQESTHVPLIIRTPTSSQKGAVCNKPVSLVDIYPTLMDLCNLPHPSYLDGHSLVPLLNDAQAPWDHLAICSSSRGRDAIITEHLRYIHFENDTDELYDHRTDPNEWTNLASDPAYAEVKQELKKALPANAGFFPSDCFDLYLPEFTG